MGRTVLGLKPKVPGWAVDAGLPPPQPDEEFSDYVSRLGLDPDSLLTGLTENSMHIANRRLTTELMRRMPEQYERYIRCRRRNLWWEDLGS